MIVIGKFRWWVNNALYEHRIFKRPDGKIEVRAVKVRSK